MTTDTQSLSSTGTLADRAAEENWSANYSALRRTQPRLAESLPLPAELAWTYGRDGALTAMHADGSWWTGCSLPRRAARSVLKTLDGNGRVGCFLTPPYAAQVRVALETLRADQAIIVLCPSGESLGVMLHCEDFAADIRSHRLWFAWGEKWNEELDRLFDENVGLPTPAYFVRPAAADHGETNRLIPIAEKIFSARNKLRAQRNEPARRSWKPSGREKPQICLIAPSHFRLWDDGGHVLAETLRGGECEMVRFDSDDPASASAAALASAARECDAVVAVNLTRAEMPEVVPEEMPWVAWVVSPRVPAAAGGRDALIVADVRQGGDAIAKGWAQKCVEVGGWPSDSFSLDKKPTAEPWALVGNQSGYLALIADTRTLEAPRRIVDLSSQHLLWDAIAAEIVDDPFALGSDVDEYLRRRQRELRIADDALDRDLFVELLLTPALQHGIARLLRGEKLPIRLFGQGWQEIEEFADIAAGPIRSRQQLAEAAGSAAALIYAWPIARRIRLMRSGGRFFAPPQGARLFWRRRGKSPRLSRGLSRRIVRF